ncbi:MAG: helix-turn-helix transcriptional regulator [Gammaproteobacteria bacterium]|nr:helix-turn-helix transcriptional regulator [Gammaproteobacteria bacterium]
MQERRSSRWRQTLRSNQSHAATIILVHFVHIHAKYQHFGKPMVHHLPSLGENLRHARKRRFPNDDLAAFALRVGVSRSTLQKMEKGELSVGIGKYYRAAQVLRLSDTFSDLLHLEDSLFDDPRLPL